MAKLKKIKKPPAWWAKLPPSRQATTMLSGSQPRRNFLGMRGKKSRKK